MEKEQRHDAHEVVAPDAEPTPRSPQIWVGSWSDYNNGVLHGAWIDANQDAADIHAAITTMLARSPTAREDGSPAEEWGIFDTDGFGGVTIGEQEPIEKVSRIARGIAQHGPAFAAYVEIADGSVDALNTFEDWYAGHWPSVEDYVSDFLEDAGYLRALDELGFGPFRSYVAFDLAGLARDLQAGGDIEVRPAEEGGVWIFHQ